MLHEFLTENRGEIIARCRAKVTTRRSPPPTDVELDHGVPLGDFLEEVRLSAILEANARSIQFTVAAVDCGVVVEVDKQTLASVLANLLMNAFKFSRPGGTVTLATRVVHERVMIEVADECGGLPPGKAEDLFRAFEQRGADRTGVGLGLAICRRGVEANGGRLCVRDKPGRGCVFTVNLPAQHAAAS